LVSLRAFYAAENIFFTVNHGAIGRKLAYAP